MSNMHKKCPIWCKTISDTFNLGTNININNQVRIISNILVVEAASVPIVRTPHSTIYGTTKESYNGREFSAFEGIPYSKPPVGVLRFAVIVIYSNCCSKLLTEIFWGNFFQEPQPTKPASLIYANNTYICMQYCPIPGFEGPLGILIQ